MGLYFGMYQGPYIEYKENSVETVKYVDSCENKNCKNHKKELKSAFCPNCGGKVTKISKTVTEKLRLDAYDLPNEYQELASMGYEEGELCHIEIDGAKAWIPNMGQYGVRLSNEENKSVELNIDAAKKELEKFKDEYLPLIDFLQEKFNDKLDLKVKFGTIVSWD